MHNLITEMQKLLQLTPVSLTVFPKVQTDTAVQNFIPIAER